MKAEGSIWSHAAFEGSLAAPVFDRGSARRETRARRRSRGCRPRSRATRGRRSRRAACRPQRCARSPRRRAARWPATGARSHDAGLPTPRKSRPGASGSGGFGPLVANSAARAASTSWAAASAAKRAASDSWAALVSASFAFSRASVESVPARCSCSARDASRFAWASAACARRSPASAARWVASAASSRARAVARSRGSSGAGSIRARAAPASTLWPSSTSMRSRRPVVGAATV